MRTISVKAENFRSYESLERKFPNRGLILVEGINLDSGGGSNGSGKTAFLDAEFWAIYGYLPAWGSLRGGSVDSVVRIGQSSCQVVVEREWAGKHVKISRSRPSKLAVWVDGKPLHGKSDDLQKQIEQMFGPAERALLSSYVAQDRGRSFLSISDAERTQVLSSFAGVEAMDAALEKAKQERLEVKRAIDEANSRVSAQEQLAASLASYLTKAEAALADKTKAFEQAERYLEDARAGAAEATRTLEVEEKAALDAALESLHQRYGALQQKSESELAAAEAKLGVSSKRLHEAKAALSLARATGQQKAPEEWSGRLTALRARKDKGLKAIEAARALRNSVAIDRAAIEAMSREMDAIASGRCPKCQYVNDQLEARQASLAERIEERASKLEASEQQLKGLPSESEVAADLAKVEADIASLSREILECEVKASSALRLAESEALSAESDAGSCVRQLEAARQSLESVDRNRRSESATKVSEIKAQFHRRRELAKDLLRKAERDAEASALALSAAADEVEVRRKELEVVELSLVALRDTVSGELAHKLDLAEDMVEFFGPAGYRSVIYDGLVARLSELADSFMKEFTEGAYGTYLEQVGQTAAGATKLVLRPVVTRSGEKIDPDLLSGGFRRRLTLSYDLAVCSVSEQGAPMILDEGLDGVDAQGKLSILPVLEKIAADRLVLLVDHTSELKSAIPTRWVATMKSGISTLSEES